MRLCSVDRAVQARQCASNAVPTATREQGYACVCVCVCVCV